MRTGRPIAPLSLGVEKRATLEGLGASAQDRAGRWPNAADCPGMRQRQSQHGGRGPARSDVPDGRQMTLTCAIS
jgi:hypothetical protein